MMVTYSSWIGQSKRLIRIKGKVYLAPENPDYPEFDITEREYIHIWGVVTYVIHKV